MRGLYDKFFQVETPDKELTTTTISKYCQQLNLFSLVVKSDHIYCFPVSAFSYHANTVFSDERNQENYRAHLDKGGFKAIRLLAFPFIDGTKNHYFLAVLDTQLKEFQVYDSVKNSESRK